MIEQRRWRKCNLLRKTARPVCSESCVTSFLKIWMVFSSWYWQGRYLSHEVYDLLQENVRKSFLCMFLKFLQFQIFSIQRAIFWGPMSEPCHAQPLLSILLLQCPPSSPLPVYILLFSFSTSVFYFLDFLYLLDTFCWSIYIFLLFSQRFLERTAMNNLWLRPVPQTERCFWL